MTTIPAHLPRLITGALETGASVKVDPMNDNDRDWIVLEITWTDQSVTYHEWRLGPDDVWSHQGPGRLTDTRARIKREGQAWSL